MTPRAASAPAPHLEIPAAPPDELLAELARAARRVDELQALGRTLRFERDGESGRMTARVHRLDSGTSSPISLRAVLDVMSGDGLPV